MDRIITIDGPAASGKSSVSRAVAKALNMDWVSTGAFYRGLALVAHDRDVDLSDEKALADLASSNIWQVKMAEEQTLVFLEGRDVTARIYAEEVGQVASKISHYPMVRQSLLEAQRNCARGGRGLVAEGRDCGTVVFPKAHLKVFLTASSEDRAKRRAMEQGRDLKQIHEAQKVRDQQDTSRQTAPLTIPPGAHVLDTSFMSLDEVVQGVLALAKKTFSH